ncbi:MAG: hypothetical protein M5R40_08745 [Anaerolineae bacterium]|nr:hypothetical protein [Anaerolineae bacterium]
MNAIDVTINGEARTFRVRPNDRLLDVLRREGLLQRQARLRDRRVRRVRRAARRRAGEQLRAAGGAG